MMPIVQQVSLVLIFLTTISSGFRPASANCLDDFVNNPANANVTDLICCDPSVNKTIPNSIHVKLIKLETIFLRQCSLIGTIPPGLRALGLLKSLEAQQNTLTGRIPSLDGGAYISIEELNLSSNTLTGTVFSDFGALTKLTLLRLHENQFSGELPSEIGLMTALTDLGLGRNWIVSTIPSSFGTLTNLTSLSLDEMKLRGTVPSQLGALTALTKLDIFKNALVGTLPQHLASLTLLSTFRISGNRFHAPIPDYSAIPGVTLDPSDFVHLAPGASCTNATTMCSLGAGFCSLEGETCFSPITIAPSDSHTRTPSSIPTRITPAFQPLKVPDKLRAAGSPVVGVFAALMPSFVLGMIFLWRHRIAEELLEQQLKMIVHVNVLMEPSLPEAKTEANVQANVDARVISF